MSSNESRYETFTLERATPTIGAFIHGLDLRDEITPQCQTELRTAFLEHEVLFLRDQHLEPQDQLRFAKVFGDPQEVSAFFPSLPGNPFIEVLESRGRAAGTDVWHSDLTWQATPNSATCLHAQDIPPCGGDTLWSSMTAAYDALPETMKNLIDGLEAVHDWEKELTGVVRQGEDGEARYEETRRKYPPMTHPVVRKHPETGRRLVYVNELFTSRISGVPPQLSDSLRNMLTGLAKTPEYQVRFRWEPNSLVIWDNRSTQHYAVGDYHPHYRRMHRVTLRGDRPA
ncbi:taurine dioxygenase [Rhodococcus sp. SC4]|uniref:TauD/TfdA dioxygenase family protein n=1 Tax=unclassified Rhodococcus (in: high G+C Gram-positive bacteria) TaxID=192944 RepID=UPI00076A386F|nr:MULTISPECIES: TauD/TfdA family dioxygenase [unclassified Rhodococcus (in: high G+C Gram-positive bacteria)]KXF56802.1 taurine dioxygenase [Rhodococcus sp. SC4]KXX55239.1 taurine dioxygenase [Rhodococcus sp. LB1]PBC55334.1 taurine dioxygenase [Rhodococcus sp. ACPA1]